MKVKKEAVCYNWPWERKEVYVQKERCGNCMKFGDDAESCEQVTGNIRYYGVCDEWESGEVKNAN